MDIPAGWISETELRDAIGVADEDKSTFHRNLVNWRNHRLLPQHYDGSVVPASHPLGFGIGNEAYYPPIMIQMVRRIDELRQRGGNMDRWLWQLWIDGFPIDVVGWCRDRLIKMQGFTNLDEKELTVAATRKPKRSDPRSSFYRRLFGRGWLSLMTWALNVAIGARPPESLFDPKSPPRSALARIFGVGTDPSIISVGVAGSQIEEISLPRLMAILYEEIGADELQRVREDCWVLSHCHKGNTLIVRVLAAMWGRVSCRAVLLPGLIILHRSPDHQASLLDVGKRYSDSPAVQRFEVPHARR